MTIESIIAGAVDKALKALWRRGESRDNRAAGYKEGI